jgi:hypothetical protein
MKKLLFGAFVALLVLLVIPGAVSAGDDDFVTVHGSISPAFDITVTADELYFGPMTAGTYDQSTIITVTSNLASWSVDASDIDADTKGDNTGFMALDATGTQPLQTLFQVGKNGADYRNIATPILDYMTGGVSGGSATVNVRQQVVAGDPAGDYFITVLFKSGSN